MYQIWPDNGGGGGGGGGGRDVRPKKKAPAEQLRSRIQRILKTQIDSYRFRWRLLALLIGHRNSKLVQEELIANLDYWQERTGQRIDVICVGMGTSKSPRGGSSLASGVSWLETMSDWRFSGQTDIILLNARFDRTQRAVALDFSTVVSFCLEHAVADRAIDSLAGLLERLIRFADSYKGDDPTWGFSDHEAKRLAGRGLKALLLSILPKALRADARRAFYFRVREHRAGAA